MFAQSRNFGRFIWAGFAILLILVFVIPQVDMSIQHESPRALATPDPFDPRAINAEEKLHQDRLQDLPRDEAISMALLLKVRALSRAGSITPGEMIWAVELIEEYQPQIAAQSSEAARRALRAHRNELIWQELPRVDPEQGVAAFDTVRQAYIDSIDYDPATAQDLAVDEELQQEREEPAHP